MKELHPNLPPETAAMDTKARSPRSEFFFSANSTGGVYYSPEIFCCGLSQQGSSHITHGTPCQDSNGLRVVLTEQNHYLITAVADGLGSCILSHEGSRTAVDAALAHCESVLSSDELSGDQQMLEMIRQSFCLAWDAIEAQAAERNQLPFSFNTTLTLTVYDGQKLHIGHIGDGGVVALFHDGAISLVTKRHNGKSAHSVYPLQSGEDNWQFLTLEESVHGFAISTDGVLDSFVQSEQNNSTVWEPFLTDLLYQNIGSSQDVQCLISQLGSFLSSEDYRARVSDDITLFVVGNTTALFGKKADASDEEETNTTTPAEQDNTQEEPAVQDDAQEEPPEQDNTQEEPAVQDDAQEEPPEQDNTQEEPAVQDDAQEAPPEQDDTHEEPLASEEKARIIRRILRRLRDFIIRTFTRLRKKSPRRHRGHVDGDRTNTEEECR